MIIKSIIIILIILLCGGNNIKSIYGQGENYHMITLISTNFDDLGFSYTFNQGRVEVARALNILDSRIKLTYDYNQTMNYLKPILQDINDPIDLILCTGLEHVQACKELAKMYENHPIVKTQFILRGSGVETVNTMQFTYNYASINYISGVFAGLYTKNNKIGFLSPGPLAYQGSNDSFTYAFWVGAKEVNPNVEFIYYNIKSYLDADKTVAAGNDLVNMGCDVIAANLNDFSIGTTAISRGLLAMGTNGFQQKLTYGEHVAYSYSYNWTKIFLPIVKRAMEGKPPKTIYADFSNDTESNLFNIEYSTTIDQYIKDKIQDKIDHLNNLVALYGGPIGRASSPIYCNDYIIPYAEKYKLSTSIQNVNQTCLTSSNFHYIYDPLPGMTYLGYYNISLVEVPFSPSLQRGVSIASGCLIIVMLLIILGIYKYRNRPAFRSASPIFLFFILLGAIIVYVGIIVWVSDLNDYSCNARLWLVTIGFTTLISCLVVKNVRIWLIFDNPELKSITIKNYQLYPWVGCCLLINIVLMAILTSVGDLREINAQHIDSLGKYEFMKVCKMNSAGASTLYTILAYFGALLLAGVFISFKIRIVDIHEFNESKAIGKTLYAISFCLFVIVPLMISPQDKQSETIILCVAGFFIVTSAILIIFLPKFWRIYEFGAKHTNELFRGKKSSTLATARKESSKSSNGSGSNTTRTNRRGNVLEEGDFSEDTESSLKELKVTEGAIHAEFTSDTVSDFDESETVKNNNNNNNNLEDNNIIITIKDQQIDDQKIEDQQIVGEQIEDNQQNNII